MESKSEHFFLNFFAVTMSPFCGATGKTEHFIFWKSMIQLSNFHILKWKPKPPSNKGPWGKKYIADLIVPFVQPRGQPWQHNEKGDNETITTGGYINDKVEPNQSPPDVVFPPLLFTFYKPPPQTRPAPENHQHREELLGISPTPRGGYRDTRPTFALDLTYNA